MPSSPHDALFTASFWGVHDWRPARIVGILHRLGDAHGLAGARGDGGVGGRGLRGRRPHLIPLEGRGPREPGAPALATEPGLPAFPSTAANAPSPAARTVRLVDQREDVG